MDVVDRRDFDLPAGGVFERNEAVVVSFVLNLAYFGFDDFGLALIADGDGIVVGLVSGYDKYDGNDDDSDDCCDNEDDEVFGGFGGGCGGFVGLAGLVGVIMGGLDRKSVV